MGALTASVHSSRTSALNLRESASAPWASTSTAANFPRRVALAASAGPAAMGPTSMDSPTTEAIVAATRSAVTTSRTKLCPNWSKAMWSSFIELLHQLLGGDGPVALVDPVLEEAHGRVVAGCEDAADPARLAHPVAGRLGE